MNYVSELGVGNEQTVFDEIHESEWEQEIIISDFFILTKRKQFFEKIDYLSKFDLIYFDAFGFDVQPELWSKSIFEKMFRALKPNSFLVTYAARSIIKKNMQEAGFIVEKLPGAPGKREMFRAKKL